ncbi:MAG: heavy metal translocating P-type ATPase, partial [Planctomyces sp.]
TGHAVGADTVGDDSVDTEQIEIAAESIVVGDFLRIRAGERFPVDAVLVRGRTSVDEQVFTGESRPIEKNPGDRLLAGTVNLDGDLIVRATAALHEGSFSRLRQLLQEARNARGEYQRLADRVSAWFFPVISLVSLLTFAVHLSSGFGPAIQNTLSVLLIACPCALGLATPLAVWTALSTAIRYQVLFRSGEAIERLAVAESACFDKTGTLTTGMPRVVQFQSFAPDVPSAQVFALARQLAEASKHPYSRAISDWCAEAQLSLPRLRAEGQLPAVSEMRTVPGCGVLATTADASEIRLGSLTFTGATSDVLQKIQSSADTAQLSVTGLSLDGRLLAVFSMTESLRPEAASAIRDCLEMGLTVTVLTGDRRGRAVQLQEELQSRIAAESADSMVSQRTLPPINMISELQPADKVDAIRQLQKNVGRTVMVGDGINDAPALAISDAGIAMGCGADVSRDSAQVCLLGNDLTRIPWAISLARQTRSVIRQNLFWAFAYN